MKGKEETFPEIEGVNWQYALKFIPKKELLFRVLEDFHERADAACRKLFELEEKLDSEKGLEEYRMCVHSLKSTSAMAGILSVSELSELLEKAARNGETERIHTDTPILVEELHKAKEHLEPFMKEWTGAAQEKPAANAVILRDFFELLRFSMEQMDISGTDACMEQVRQYSYPPELQEAIDRIGQKIKKLDYTGAEKEITRAEKLIG